MRLATAAVGGSQARTELQALADEQAALRRVAELVARGAASEEVFIALSREASALLGDLPVALMVYDDSGAHVVATCNSPAPVGLHVPFSAGTAIDELFRTGRPAHVDHLRGDDAGGCHPGVGHRLDHGCPDRGRGSHPGRARREHRRPAAPGRHRGPPRAVRRPGRRRDRQRRDAREAHRLAGARRRHRRRDPSATAARRPRRRAAAAGARPHRAQDGPQRGRGRDRRRPSSWRRR